MTYKTLPQPSVKNEQIREYLKAAQKGQDSLFVVAVKNGWTIRKAGTRKNATIFPTMKEAIIHAQKSGKLVFSPKSE